MIKIKLLVCFSSMEFEENLQILINEGYKPIYRTFQITKCTVEDEIYTTWNIILTKKEE